MLRACPVGAGTGSARIGPEGACPSSAVPLWDRRGQVRSVSGVVKPAVRQDRDGLADALREARLAEAAHFEAALDLRDSKTLRLQILKDELLPTVQSSPEAKELFDLTLLPGDPAETLG